MRFFIIMLMAGCTVMVCWAILRAAGDCPRGSITASGIARCR